MTKYRAPSPIGYRGPFRNMADIYQEYRNTLMNKGPYKAYFAPRASYGESQRKFAKTQYSGEQRPMSEPERKERQSEIKPDKTVETKTEDVPKIETSQGVETSQKTEPEKESQDKPSSEKSSLSELQERMFEQTDVRTKNRPSPYDKAEMRW